PIPQGERPAALGTIWYPYLPSPDARPVLKAVLVDEEGRRWGEGERTIDLGLTIPRYFAGPRLQDLHLSPDGTSFIADIGAEQVQSYWVDPSLGEVKSIVPNVKEARFLAWGTGHRILALVLVGPGGLDKQGRSVWLADLNTQEYREVLFPVSEYGFLLSHAFAFSPDGSWIADAAVYGPTPSHEGSDIEIALQPSAGGERATLAVFHIPEEAVVLRLTWSPNGQNLALSFLTEIHDADSPPYYKGHLWLIDKDSGGHTVLVHDLYLTMDWSPDGRYIAFLRERDPTQRKSAIDLWLFDSATSSEIQLTAYTDRRVTSAVWSPDGHRLAFAVTVEIGDSIEGYDKIGDYGEIWMTSLDGKEQYPVAGPTAPDAPVAWLPAAKGGQK
ncbi:MAG: hypothetical protein ACP5OO_13680, partial [Chloroflexia bacterium]